ncbi:GNAT family N-acetyltransferase [Litorihabitans aurantiacus]|uniref:N-acetyltransferase domain-containing protein n=1 Tax=Litorihabitans aurantiacus TaxID=1930061 RepID=A0AA37XDW1_9MICO|nr:GNAT family N-acetyltransferase [Litorihabitans aurantiacus]GMA31365.1 hypothetical protein GCM10025875_13570 [Litorihabitans aurantiacus]
MSAGPLPAPLPQVLETDLLILAEREDWAHGRAASTAGAALLARTTPQGEVLMARGAAVEVEDLLDAEARLRRRSGAEPALWLSAPRDVVVPARVLDALGLVPFSQWDWMALEAADALGGADLPGGTSIRAVDVSSEAEVAVVREVLRRTNPRSTADPLAAPEVAWAGAYDGDALVGVFGARGEQGHGEGASWHLHGLGVLAEKRGRGLGRALTAHLAAVGLAAGADWISLGLYAENDAARRLYRRLGFTTRAEMSSYGPASATRPLR